jgi:hypothetical protein
LRRIVGDAQSSSTFSGKDADGRPVRGHPHVSILSLDEDGDGFIDTLLVTSPQPFSVEEQRAIDRLRPVQRRNGHPMVLTPIRYGMREQLLIQRVVAPASTQRRARWLDFRRARKDDAPQPGYGLRATFEDAVLAPFSLGYGGHFGLGCFVPAGLS